VLIGGFHFMDIDVSSGYSDVLNKAAEVLMTEHEGRTPTMFYTCHCTGAAQYSYLKKRMCDRLEYLSSGQTVEI
jgi:7,8-dihydropterin-6-yl-methyl-4-(beta-D-ribofuranosyl)aminobenzene 5'-phosphate synthase